MCMPSTGKSRKQHRRNGRAAYKGFLISGKDNDQDGSGVKEASGESAKLQLASALYLQTVARFGRMTGYPVSCYFCITPHAYGAEAVLDAATVLVAAIHTTGRQSSL
jgi:hypothetical protein